MATDTLVTREQFLSELASSPVHACAILNDDESCSICTCKLADEPANDEEERAVLLHDTHVIGESCARHWLATANSCPKCRTPLFKENDKHGYDDNDIEDLEEIVAYVSSLDPAVDICGDDYLVCVLRDLYGFVESARLADTSARATDEALGRRRDPRFTGLCDNIHKVQKVRQRFWLATPHRQGVNITETFRNPYVAFNERERVRINFTANVYSYLRIMRLQATVLEGVNYRSGRVVSAAGHPLTVGILDQLGWALRQVEGGYLRISALRQQLRASIRMLRSLQQPDVPAEMAEFVDYAIDEIVAFALERKHDRDPERA